METQTMTRDEALATVKGPGKFEGCALVDLYAHDLVMLGDGETIGEDGGASWTRVDGPFDGNTAEYLDERERMEIADCAGAIVHESSDGFVDVEWFDTARALDCAWDDLVADLTPEDEDEDEDSDESTDTD